MNAQNAHEYLPLIQAMADGKTLEYYHKYNGWAVSSEIPFDMKPEFYRIKPEPRRWTMVRCLNNGFIYEDTGTDGFDSDVWERLTVVEVLE